MHLPWQTSKEGIDMSGYLLDSKLYILSDEVKKYYSGVGYHDDVRCWYQPS